MPSHHPAERQRGRLEALARVVAARADSRALLVLGSLAESTRADAYSDLDLFFIVAPGAKVAWLEDLTWLAAAHPIACAFRNTPDGHKVLFADGMLCEMAVFTVDELAHIPFAPGRVAWAHNDVDLGRLAPTLPLPAPPAHGEAWLIGEILTALLVGLQRDARGETLSATRLIQSQAVDLWLALEDQRARAAAPDAPDGRDPFNPTRRLEQRHPHIASVLPLVLPGYGHNRAAARALLEALAAVLVQHGAFAPLVDAVRERL